MGGDVFFKDNVNLISVKPKQICAFVCTYNLSVHAFYVKKINHFLGNEYIKSYVHDS